MAGLLSGGRIALRVVGPDVGFPEHAGAAAGIFGALMIGIEAVNNRCLTPRFALAHHHAGAAWLRFSAPARSMPERARWPLGRAVTRRQSATPLRAGPLTPWRSRFRHHQCLARSRRISRRSQTVHPHWA